MASVFICPVDDETAAFGVTLEVGCALETLLPLIRDEGRKEALERLYSDGRCHVWGLRDRGDNLSSWSEMAPDDLVLGYRNRSILSASTVLVKARDPALADRLWGSTPEGPFELMCFTGKPHVGEVPIVSQMTGYLDLDYRGFTKLSSEKCQAILHAFGSLDVFVRLGLRYDFPFSFRHSE
jgi:hypothetical protein